MSVPLRNQGTPLPPEFPYSGEWLDEPRIFLYVPTVEQRGIPGNPQFTAEINPTSDNWCFGFDAQQLAFLLETTADILFLRNRLGGLALENVEANTETGEGATMKRYTFRLGEKTAALIIESLWVAGHA
jgi:hypothetical protein